MLCLLHGYQLEGSGSNLWTRSILEVLCRKGKEVHLVCQENKPEKYDFISDALVYLEDGSRKQLFSRKVSFPGKVIFHRPYIGKLIPVYLGKSYPGFERAIPMSDLTDDEIANYINKNVFVVENIIKEFGITFLHANHAVLMSVVALRTSQSLRIPYGIMPHGSAIEYVVKKDVRFKELASEAFAGAKVIFISNEEIQERLRNVFPNVPNLNEKMVKLGIGVDTSHFKPLSQIKPLSQKQRMDALERLKKYINELPEGKNTILKKKLFENLTPSLSKESYYKLLEQCSTYRKKTPDSTFTQELSEVAWDRERIALFVGRLISEKGIQSILAALPFVLEKDPELRLIVVGHGPLREFLEAFLIALEKGDGTLVNNIAQWDTQQKEQPDPYLQGLREFIQEQIDKDFFSQYIKRAVKYLKSNRVIFSGYLSHRELMLLFPLCHVVIIPSIVVEAGPMVLLEALSCGCFPLGTNQGGMAVNIRLASQKLSPEHADLMKLNPDGKQMIFDIIDKLPKAFSLGSRYSETFRDLALTHFDWNCVAKPLLDRS